MKHYWKIYFFTLLQIGFFIYSYILYSSNSFQYRNDYKSSSAQQGELVWQKYNCQSCHQMYGLGGYLGPDLTNVISVKGKNNNYILAIIKSGSIQMPSFNLSDVEKINLIEFLKSTDASGKADPRSFDSQFTGMISNK